MRGNILFAYIIGFCPSLAMQTTEPTKQTKGIVGGSITFLTPVLRTGSLLYKGLGAAAMVLNGISDTELMGKFKGRLQWDSQTGLFTITHLRTEDSGTYAVDCKDGQTKLVTFQLEVYKNVSTPTVMWTQLGRKNCSVRCSVENGKETEKDTPTTVRQTTLSAHSATCWTYHGTALRIQIRNRQVSQGNTLP
ncbi:hypothetical protein SKAU_G00393160 [Synaphobranchus kaupii]|uniref:Immunoglobulin V-set domain-containing protein n=1 Tax=Synaphobranchus kaupii TaxID=118154 RepID=A0A9Q1EBW5_SYNKA|nr:hypothetical protein SKAU_G00393160 [Synaphobranchus kaupii]